MAIEMATPRITLRIIFDGSTSSAQHDWSKIREAFAGLVDFDEPTIRAYWKMPATELTMNLYPLGDSDEAYDKVTSALGSGWEMETNDEFARWSVWNRGVGELLVPTISWAHVELIRR
ncbi:MAG TPA: hypothetical protein VGI10_21430 [Polyangiaceae bacterium]|jgi:hypothetical protein